MVSKVSKETVLKGLFRRPKTLKIMPASMKTAVVVMWDHAEKLRRKQLCPS